MTTFPGIITRMLSAAILVLAGSMIGCGASVQDDGKQPQTWRFAIEETQGSVQDSYAQRFKELIEQRTDGRITVEVYPYGTLGTSNDITELLQNNTVQFGMASPGHLGTLIPETQVFLLHFLLSDDELVNKRVLESPELLETFDALYREQNMKLLSIFQEGWQVWTTKRRPIRTLEDFAGLRIRVMTSPLLLAAYEAYGASPTPLSYGEVYSALQLNMIDGQVNPVFAIQEMSFHEVLDYMTFANHVPFIATAVASKTLYDGLLQEDRAMVDEVIAEIDDYIFDVQRRFNVERLDLILSDKSDIEIINDITDEERERFRQASLPVRDRYLALAPNHGEKILELVLNLVQEMEE